MKNFIKGTLFVALILPLVDGIVNIASQIVEFICTKIAVKTYKEKASIEEEPEINTSAIGFDIPCECEEEYYDDDEE